MFRLALRQTEGLVASIIALLGLDLAVPDHSTLSRRAETLEVPCPGREPVHLLVDSTGLKLCGPGEWLVEKHGTRTRRGWRKLHLATDADTGRLIAERGRMGWQRASGYSFRALVEANISRWKRVIGDGLRSQTKGCQSTEVAIAAGVLNRMLELGRPQDVRLA